MVIQCPHCQARFKLPQGKVKPGGTKVRCTKCKIIFMVTPPQEDVLPEHTSDEASLGNSGEENPPDFKEEFAADFDSAEFFSDGDEGDEFLLGGTALEDDGSDFFAVDDAESEEPGDLSWSDDSGPVAELPASDELLGGGLETPESAEPTAKEEPSGIALALAEEEDQEFGEGVSGLPEEEFFFDEASSRASLPAPRPPAERRKKSRWGWLWLLVLLLLLAGGGYIYHARQQLTASWQKLLVDWQLIPEPPAEGKGLKPVKLSGYFITNKREGRLFIIQGQVLNEGAEPRAAIVVQGSVYASGGVPLAQQRAFCGNPMGKEQLRAWSIMRMDERMHNQFGEMLANLNLEPQRTIPFTLVFKNLPGEVAEFEVVVEASEPVIK